MPMRLAFAVMLAFTFAAVRGAEPSPPGPAMIAAYFQHQAKQIADACLSDVKTRADWEKQRPELRRQFLDMLGLWPLPPRTDLQATVTGTVDTDKFVIEKLHYQSMPGLYVTAHLYVPKQRTGKLPAILYLCGHGGVVVNNIAYGNKVFYQHHPAWFAEHGYVCLIIDSLELGEIAGLHHGTYPRAKKQPLWWWHTLGYTPAGIECWNCMRAIDYLETRSEVDAKKIGVTGRSGGGAYSWWLLAADDRPQCFVPVAGIADLQAHLVEGVAPRLRKGVIAGHCDCMYFTNTYRWDFPMVAALCAPRPLLLGNSDVDDIFPVPGYRRIADKVRRIYGLYGASDRFDLLETKGPHKDTPELRLGAYRWMNRWLKNDQAEVSERAYAKLPPERLRVFERNPDAAINATVHETFVKPARLELPEAAEVARAWWTGRSPDLRQALENKVFRNWPVPVPALNIRPAGDVTKDGLRLRAFDFTSEAAIELRLWLVTAEKVEKPSLVVLTALDEPGWRDWLTELGPNHKDMLRAKHDFQRDDKKFEANRRVLEKQRWAFATIVPRGIGPTRWAADGSVDDVQIRRRFALVGQTLDGQRVWDVRRGLAVLRTLADLQGAPLWLQGKKELAGIVLFAGLFERDVARLDLWHPPESCREGPTFLNVCRVLDMPQAIALAFPKQVRIYVKDDAEARLWTWPERLQKALGKEYLKVRKVPD